MTVDEFKKKHKRKRVSELEKYRDDILNLWNDNYSQETIVKFLKTKNIDITQQYVSIFLNRVLKKEDSKNTKVKNETKKTKTETEETTSASTPKKQFFNVDIKKKVGKSTELEKPDWL